MVDVCIQKYGSVVLLIPEVHFEKNVVFPFNLELEQRLECLKLLYGRNQKVAFGTSKEVLFIKLEKELAKVFPRASIHMAIGKEGSFRGGE